MSELSTFREQYIHVTHLDIGDAGDWVELREPSALEMRNFLPEAGDVPEIEKIKVRVANIKVMTELLPKCLINHSFLNGQKKAGNQQVADMLIAAGSKFDAILIAWMQSLPFERASEEKSDSSQE